MKYINKQQQILKQQAAAMSWPRATKFWDWQKLCSHQPRRVLSAQQFAEQMHHCVAPDEAVTIRSLSDVGQVHEKQLAQLLAYGGLRITKPVLLQQSRAKTHMVVHIADNVEAEIAFVNSLFAYWGVLYIVVGKGATVKITDTHGYSSDAYGAATVCILAGVESNVQYHVQTIADCSYQSHYQVSFDRCAQVNCYFESTISAPQLHTQHYTHKHSSSKSVVTWIMDGQSHGVLYGNIATTHVGRGTTADVVARAVGRRGANLYLDGWIDIGTNALETNSYLQQDILLTDEQSIVTAVPNLEILNNDVKASHGATLGMVDQQQLQYLQSRGLSAQAAEALLIKGFLNVAHHRFEQMV